MSKCDLCRDKKVVTYTNLASFSNEVPCPRCCQEDYDKQVSKLNTEHSEAELKVIRARRTRERQIALGLKGDC